MDAYVLFCKNEMTILKEHFDLEHGHERGLWFYNESSWCIILFCQVCKHYKGEFAGQPFEPEPWQLFFLWMLFGCLCDDGTRRFRTAYLKIARKKCKIFIVLRDNLSVDAFAAKFEPVGRDSVSLDGLHVSGAIMDELHAWKNRDLWAGYP